MTFEDEAEKYGVPPTMRSDDDDDDPNANVSYKDDNNNINNNIDDGNPGLPTDFCADASYCWEEADGAGGATPRPGAALSSFLLTSHDCAVKGVVPHENDVLMGRGGESYGHNQHYLKVIAERRPDWQKATTHDERDEIARQIIASIASLSPSGRFLRKQDVGGSGSNTNPNGKGKGGSRSGASATAAKKLWYPVEEKCVIDKIRQALREKAKPPPTFGETLEAKTPSEGSSPNMDSADVIELVPARDVIVGRGGLVNSNPANARLRKIVTKSISDYKRRGRDGKRDFIWSLVANFRNETNPKRRFLERPAKDKPWKEAPKDKVYDAIQKMFGRDRKEVHQNSDAGCVHPEVVESAEGNTPPLWAADRGDTKPPPRPCGVEESNGVDGASLKTESDTPVHEASSSSNPTTSRKIRKRRKTLSAGSMVRRRLENTECVDSINDNDVMCDRGVRQGADDYQGNARLFEHLERYKKELPGADERRIAESVVQHIRNMVPPGRFLKENADGKWYHIGDEEAIRRTEHVVRWVGRLSHGQRDAFALRSDDDEISETGQIVEVAASTAFATVTAIGSPPLEVVVKTGHDIAVSRGSCAVTMSNTTSLEATARMTSGPPGSALRASRTPRRSQSGLLEASTLPNLSGTSSTGPDLEQSRHSRRSQSSQSVAPLHIFDQPFFPAGASASHSLGSIHTRTSSTPPASSMTVASAHAGHLFVGSLVSAERNRDVFMRHRAVRSSDVQRRSDSESSCGRAESSPSRARHFSPSRNWVGRLRGFHGHGSSSTVSSRNSLAWLEHGGGSPLTSSANEAPAPMHHFLHGLRHESGGTIEDERPARTTRARASHLPSLMEMSSAAKDTNGAGPHKPHTGASAHPGGDSRAANALAAATATAAPTSPKCDDTDDNTGVRRAHDVRNEDDSLSLQSLVLRMSRLDVNSS